MQVVSTDGDIFEMNSVLFGDGSGLVVLAFHRRLGTRHHRVLNGAYARRSCKRVLLLGVQCTGSRLAGLKGRGHPGRVCNRFIPPVACPLVWFVPASRCVRSDTVGAQPGTCTSCIRSCSLRAEVGRHNVGNVQVATLDAW